MTHIYECKVKAFYQKIYDKVDAVIIEDCHVQVPVLAHKLGISICTIFLHYSQELLMS